MHVSIIGTANIGKTKHADEAVGLAPPPEPEFTSKEEGFDLTDLEVALEENRRHLLQI